MRKERVIVIKHFFWHAVSAAEVATVSDGNAQVANTTLPRVDQ